MAAAGLVAVLFLVIAIGSGLVLYALVRADHAGRDVVDRDEAERRARRDGRDEP